MDSNATSLRRQYHLRLGIGVVLLLLLALPASIHSAAAIQTLRNLPSEWLPDNLPIKQEFERYVERFAIIDVVQVAWPEGNLDDPGVDRAAALFEPLSQSAPQVASAPASWDGADSDSPLTTDGAAGAIAQEPWAQDFVRRMRTISGTDRPIDWVVSGSSIKRGLTGRPLNLSDRSARRRLRGVFVGPDAQQTCLMISLGPSLMYDHREVLPLMQETIARAAGVPAQEVVIVGGPTDGAAVDAESIRSIERFSPPSAIIAAVLCWVCLRSLPLTIAVTSVATIGQGMVLALVYYWGTEMNAVLIILPPLVFVLTVSAGIHLSNYYLDIIAQPDAPEQVFAARQAMQIGVPPCFLSTLTTMVGLLSLLLVRLQPVQVFGAVAAIGLALTLALLILILPGAMLLTRRVPSGHGPARDNFLTRWARARLERPWPVIIIFVLIAGVAMVGIGKLTTTVSVPGMFLPDSDLRQDYRWFENQIGPTMTGDFLIEYPTGTPVSSLEQLQAVIAVHAAMQPVLAEGGTMSAATFLAPVPTSRSFNAVARRAVLRDQIELPETTVKEFGYLVTEPDSNVWRMTIRFNQADGNEFQQRLGEVLEAARDAIAAAHPDPAQRPAVRMSGYAVIVNRAQEILLRDLFRSFLTAFAIIAVVMIISRRSLAGGLLAMLPNVIPTAVLFGSMGWIGLPLDIGSVMTASVALGIAVDDTVHLLSRFNALRRRGQGALDAAHGALIQCGSAMFQTTVVCSLSLLAYGFSEFVPTRRFAFFMFGLLAVAFFGVSLLLPAMMASPLGRYLGRAAQPESSERTP